MTALVSGADRRISIQSPTGKPEPGRLSICDAMKEGAGGAWYVVSPVPGYVPDRLLDGTCAFMRTGVLYRVTRRAQGVLR